MANIVCFDRGVENAIGEFLSGTISQDTGRDASRRGAFGFAMMGVVFIFLTTVLFLLATVGQARAAGPFTCDERYFVSQGEANTQLSIVDFSSKPPSLGAVGPAADTQYNATGFNPIDGFIYAIESGNPSVTTNSLLLKIGNNGTTEVVDADSASTAINGVKNLTNNDEYFAGTFAPDGRYFVAAGASSGEAVKVLKVIDVTANPIAAVDVKLKAEIDVNDLAWVGGRGAGAGLYAVTVPEAAQGDARLVRIDPATGVVTTIGPSVTNGPRFGALFGSPNGLFGIANGGEGLYQFDLQTGRATRLSAAPGSHVNDGANCPLANHQLDADLAVTKTNTPLAGPNDQADDTFSPGETRTYKIVVSNNGPTTANGVHVVDQIPDGIDPATVKWVCGDGTGGGVCRQTSASGTGIDTLVDLPITTDQNTGANILSSVTFELTLSVPNEFNAALLNRVEVAAPEGILDRNLQNNVAIDSDVATGQISLNKRLIKESGTVLGFAEPGEQLTYRLTLSNDGGADVSGYKLTDVFDANATFVSAGNGGIASGHTITWDNLTVKAGTPLEIEVVVQVVNPIPAGVTHIANLIYETGQTPPPCQVPGDVSDVCVQTPTVGSVTLNKALIKESGTVLGFAEPGEQLTYRLTLSNDGGADVSGYKLTDVFDANATFVSAGNGGIASGHTITWDNLTVKAGTPLEIEVVVQVVNPIPAGVTHIANLIYETGQTPPPCQVPGDVSDVCVQTPTVGSVTLNKALIKESGTVLGFAEPGEQLTYRLTLSNDGGADVSGYKLTDVFDANATFVSAGNGGIASGHTITWDNLTVKAGTPLEIEVVVQVVNPIPAGVTHIANLIYETGQTPPPCQVPGDVSDVCVQTPTVGSVTLNKALIKESGTVLGFAEPGEQLTYRLTLSNDGGADVSGYKLTDVFDANATFVSAGNGGIASGHTITWDNLTVKAGTPLEIEVVVQVVNPIPAGVTHIANLIYETGQTPPPCQVPGDVSDVCVQTPTVGSVTLNKALIKESGTVLGFAEPGEQLTYRLTLSNDGGADVSGYKLTDVFDANATFVSAGNGGIASGHTITWDNLTVKAGTPLEIEVVVQVVNPIPAGVTHIANLIYETGQTPPPCQVPGDVSDVCVQTPTVGSVTLNKALIKESGTVLGFAEPGEQLTYRLTLSNDGGADVSGYKLTDVFDANATFVSAGNGGIASGHTITWDNLTVKAGTPLEIEVVVQVVNPIPAGVTHIANLIYETGQTPPPCQVPGDVSDVCVQTPTVGSVTLNKALIKESGTVLGFAEPGEQLTYRLTLSNDGGADVSGYKLTDVFDANATFVSAGNGGIASGHTITWDNLTVKAGTPLEIEVVVQVVNPIPAGVTHIANLIYETGQTPPPCQVPGDVSDVCVQTPTVGSVTLNKALIKESGTVLGFAEPGEQLTYRLTLSNDGGADVSGYKLTDVFDANATFVSAGNGGIASGHTITWDNLTVKAGTPLEIEVVVQVVNPIPAGVTHIANLIYETGQTPPPCQVPGDVSDVCVQTPTVGSVTLNKALIKESGTVLGFAEPGEQLTYRLTLSNDGGADVSGYKLTDVFDANATFVSAGNGGIASGHTITWDNLTVKAGTPLEIEVVVQVVNPIPAGVTHIANLIYETGQTPPPCQVPGDVSDVCVQTPTVGSVTLNKALIKESGTVLGFAEPGEQLTYRLTLSNDGGADVSGYKLTDVFDANATFVSAGNGGIASGHTITWDNLTVKAGTPLEIEVVVQVVNPIPAGVTHIANLIYETGQTPPPCQVPGDVSDVCVQTPTVGSVTLNKALIKESGTVLGFAEPGEQLTYRLTLSNDGGADVSGYKLTDVFDANATFVSAGNGGIASGHTITWDNLTVKAGTPLEIEVVVQVVNPIPAGVTHIANLIYETGQTPPPCQVPGDVSDVCVQTPTVGSVTLNKALIKESGTVLGFAEPGEQLTYRLTLSNDGGADVSGYKLTDVFDANATFVSAGNGGIASGHTITWDNLTVKAGTPLEIEVVVQVVNPIPAGVTHIANLIYETGQTPPPCQVPGDVSDVCVQTPTVGSVTLNKALIKESGTVLGFAEPGEQLTYRLTLSNDGGADVSGYKLTDVFDANATFVSAGNGGIASGHTITWDNLTVKAGTPLEIEVVVQVVNPIPAGVTHIANLIYETGQTPPPCQVPGDVSDVCVQTPTVGSVTLNKALIKESGTVLGFAEPGEQLTYRLTLSNDGGADVSGYKLTDVFDANATFVSAGNGGIASGHTITWDNLTVKAGTPLEIEVVVQVVNPIPAGVTHIANLIYETGQTPPPCQVPGDVSDVCVQTPTVGSVTLNKALIKESGTVLGFAEPGEQLTYRLTLSNDGGADVSGYKLTDVFDANATFVSAGNGGIASGHTITWDNLTVKAGTPLEIEVVVQVVNPIPAGVTHIANLIYETGQTPPPCQVPGDVSDVCVQTPTVGSVTLNKALIKESGTVLGFAEPGEQLTYRLTLSNDGGADVSGYKLTDVFDANATFVSAGNGGIASGHTITWDNLTVKAGTPLEIEVVVQVVNPIPAGVTHIANLIYETGQTPPPCQVPGDVSDVCVQTPTVGSVTLNKALIKESGTVLGFAEPGEQLTYRLTLSNDGGADVSGYKLTDVFDANATFVSAGNGGIASGHTITWDNLTVKAGTPLEIEVVVQVVNPIPAGVTHIANLIYETGQTPPPCQVPGDVSDVCVQTPTVGSVTLNKALIKESGTVLGFAEPGEQLTYRLTLSNDGGADVSGYKLTDVFDANATFVSAGNGGIASGHTITWDNLTVKAGTPLEIEVVVQVVNPIPAGVTHIANLIYETGQTPPPCQVPGDVSDVCVQTPTVGSVTLNKALIKESGTVLGFAEPGEQLTYRLTLSNDGGADVSGYKLTDVFDANATFVSAGNGGIASGHTITWDNLTVKAGTPLEIEVVVQVVNPIPAGVTHIANLIYETGQTPPPCQVPGDVSDVCVQTPTVGSVTLNKALIKESGTVLGFAEPGEQLTYRLTLSNDGGADVSGYKLTDVFDANATFVSAGNGGIASGHTITWDNLTVKAGTPLEIEVVVQVVNPIPAGVTHIANLIYETGQTPPPCVGPSDAGKTCVVTPASPTGSITIIKKVGLQQVHRGDQVPYTILVTNNDDSRTATVTVTDRIPSGFRYVANSASVDAVKREPAISGRLLSFENVAIAAGHTVEVKLSLLVLSTVEAGRHRNFANALGPTGEPEAPEAHADVIIASDAVFDCSEVIGRVFDDVNRNGYPDEGEVGLPGVRVATVTGLLITTDQFGRYHIPCAARPDARIGSNFVLKLDVRTLPTGYSVTSENPRVVRLTAGSMSKLNFGASIGRVVSLDLTDEAFEPGRVLLTAHWADALETLFQVLKKEQASLHLRYLEAHADFDLAKKRLEETKNKINDIWLKKGGSYRLEIETRVEAAQ